MHGQYKIVKTTLSFILTMRNVNFKLQNGFYNTAIVIY